MKKFVYQFIVLVSLILLSLMSYNYFTDIYGIFRSDFSQPRPTEPNQHFIKVKYLIENPNKYNAYCFGSSRVGNLDFKKVKNRNNYYNMTYSQGLPKEWLDDIKILLKSNVNISQILLGIDDFSFRVDPKSHEFQYLRIPYKENNLKTYFSLLLKKPSNPIFLQTKDKSNFFDIYDSGRPLHPYVDEEIEKNIKKHVEDKKFNESSNYYGNRIDETIQEINEIKEIADANNIELIVFINPIHQTTYLSNDLDEFNEFKRQLVKITNYYDFSGLNYITTNNYYYYETSHYRPIVGDIILNRIFNTPSNAATDFGIYVTPQNIDNHIANLEKQIKK